MQVLCLVGNNGRSTEKSKKAKFEVETHVGEMEARKVVLFGGHGIGITNNTNKQLFYDGELDSQ